MDALRDIEDNAFDLAIVDPPYGINQSAGKNRTRGRACTAKNYKDFAGGDKTPPEKEYFDEVKRVSVNQIIWGSNHFMDLLNERSSCWIVWDKNNNSNHFADCELAYTSFDTAVRKFMFTWNGMIQQNMKNKELRIHPTQKPVALYKWLLENYAKEGDKILDTHLGSGSIAVACWDMGYDLTGFELDEHYFNSMIERVNKHKAQLQLF